MRIDLSNAGTLLLRLSVCLLALSLCTVGPSAWALQPQDNLVVENIPEIPDALVEEVGRYTEFRSANFAGWHPVRREMLINTRFANTQQVHVVKFPGGARTQLTFYKDSCSGGNYQQIDGSYFVFNKDIGGDENYQKFKYAFATGDVTMLTDGKSRNTGGVWSHSGRLYAYESNRRNKKDMDIWVMDPAAAGADNKLVAELEGGGWGVLDWSRDDKQLLLMEYVSVTDSNLWLLDIAKKEKKLLTKREKGKEVSYGAGVFSVDGKGFYTTTDLDSEFKRLAYVDLQTMKHTFLTDHIKWDVDDFALSWDGKNIAFITNEDGAGKLHVMSTATRKEKPLPAMPIAEISGLAWHKNNVDIGFSMNTARYPNDAYSLNLKTNKLERWTESETGGLNTSGFAEAEVIHWKSFDGKTISGLLYKPPAKFSGPRPVSVIIHGGPEGQSTVGFLGRLNYYLNELGIALIFPNVRGSTGYGKTFTRLDNGFLREDSYKDINALFDWIGQRKDLDSSRIMVSGGSYGGHMTLAISAFYPERIKAAVDIVGPSHLVTFLERTEAYRRDLRRVEYGDERDPKMREFLEKIAPRNHAEKIKKPLFVVQGANDPRVPLKESEDMVEVIRKSGTPVWYLMAKDEGHGFRKKNNADFQFYATIMFMKQFLLAEKP